MGSIPVGISASRGASVLGLSKYSTPLEAWIKIMHDRDPARLSALGFELPERVSSPPMLWGLAFEQAVVELSQLRRLEVIEDQERFYTHDKFDFVTCHIDGRYDTSHALHEGKTTNIRTFRDSWGEPGTDHVPGDYQIQCQHQMACSGAERVVVSVLVFPVMVTDFEGGGVTVEQSEDGAWCVHLPDGLIMPPGRWARTLAEMGFFHQYEIERNETLISEMLERYDDFWNAHILGETPPPSKKYDDIKKLLTEPVGTVVATERIEQISSEDKQLADEIKAAQGRRSELKRQIGQYMVDELEGASLDDDSREKIIMRAQNGRKIRSYSKKGGLR